MKSLRFRKILYRLPAAIFMAAITAVFCFSLTAVFAESPHPQEAPIVNFQGRVEENDIGYDGTAKFNISIGNNGFAQTYWQSGNVETEAAEGVFNILLGDTSIANMNAMTDGVFAHTDETYYLRVAFGTAGTAWGNLETLSPDQRLVHVPFATNADMLDGLASPDSAIVGISDSQTLTNKTLTEPVLTRPAIDSVYFSITPGALPDPATEGYIAYDNTSDTVKFYDGTSWVDWGESSSASPWTRTGTTVSLANAEDDVSLGSNENLIYTWNGSATNLLLALNDTTKTGIFQAANSQIDFVTQSSTRLSVRAAGQLRFTPQASDPDSGGKGDIYFNSSTDTFMYHDGNSWKPIASGEGSIPNPNEEYDSLFATDGSTWIPNNELRINPDPAGIGPWVATKNDFRVGYGAYGSKLYWYTASNTYITVPSNDELTIFAGGNEAIRIVDSTTADEPALSFQADTDTGFYHPAANTISVATAGTERLSFRDTGQVRFIPQSSDPAGGAAGDIYFNSSTDTFMYHDGSNWQPIASGFGAIPEPENQYDTLFATDGDNWFPNDELNIRPGARVVTKNALQVGSSGYGNKLYWAANSNAYITVPSINRITLNTADTVRWSIESTGNLVFNETGTTADARYEGNTDPFLLYLDGGEDAFAVGTDSVAAYKATIQQTAAEGGMLLDQDGAGDGLYIAQDGAGNAIEIAHAATADNPAIAITNADNKEAIYVDQNADTDDGDPSATQGGAIHVNNSGNLNSAITAFGSPDSTQTAPLVNLKVDGANFEQPVLKITADTSNANHLYLVPQTSPGATSNDGEIYMDDDGYLKVAVGGNWVALTGAGDGGTGGAIYGSGSDKQAAYWVGDTELSSEAAFAYDYDTDTLTVANIGAFTLTGAVDAGSQAITNVDINSGAIDGTNIGFDAAADANFSNLTADTIAGTGLNGGRVTYTGADGILVDSANLTFDGTTLTANQIGAFTLTGAVDANDQAITNVDINSGAIDNTDIGQDTQALGDFTNLTADSFALPAGATIVDISDDTTLGDDSSTAGVTEHAVKNYVDTSITGLNFASGTGADGRVAYWSNETTLTGEEAFKYDETNDKLAIDSGATDGDAVEIQVNSLTSGIGLEVSSTQDAAGSDYDLVSFTASTGRALLITHSGGGSGAGNETVLIDRNSNGRALTIEGETTTQYLAYLTDQSTLTSGNILRLHAGNTGFGAGGSVLYVDAASNEGEGKGLTLIQRSSGDGIYVSKSNTAAAGIGARFNQQTYSGNGNFDDDEGGAVHIYNNQPYYAFTIYSPTTLDPDKPLVAYKAASTNFDQPILDLFPAAGSEAPPLYLRALSGAPDGVEGGPQLGMIYADSGDNSLRFYNGTAWVMLTGDSGAADIYATRELDNLQDVAINTALLPGDNNTIDLGSDPLEFKDIWIDGIAYLDEVDIDAGAIDGTDIGANTPAYGEFTEVNADFVELDSSGTEGAPALAWDGDLDTGFYRVDPGVIGVSNNGSLSVTIDATGHLQLSGNGSNGSPILALGGETDTGLYQQNDDEITFTHGGTRRYAMRSTGAFQIVGAAGDPAAVAGGIFYNSTENALKYSDGSNWITLTGTGAGGELPDPTESYLLRGNTTEWEATANLQIDDSGELVFNEDGGDDDARFEGANDPYLLYLDGLEDAFAVGTDNVGSYKATIQQTANEKGLLIDQDDDDQIAVQIETAGTGQSIWVDQNGNTNTDVDGTHGGSIHVDNRDNTGSAISAYSTANPAAPLVWLKTGASFDGEPLLRIESYDGAGETAAHLHLVPISNIDTAFNTETGAIYADTDGSLFFNCGTAWIQLTGAGSGGGGAGTVMGSGSAGTVPRWATESVLEDSIITDDGSTVTVGGVLDVSDNDIDNVADIAVATISADDGSQFSISNDWTNTGNTVADLGEVTTADINGGTIDGTNIGFDAAADANFSNLTADTIAGTGFIATRLIFADTGGILADDGDMVFDGDTLTLKQFTTAANGEQTINAIRDEDNMGSDEATALATQQSIKAYVDTTVDGANFATQSLDNLSNVAINASLIPDNDDTYDLGSTDAEWRALWVDQSANIDSLYADTADIDGGTIDSVNIGFDIAGDANFSNLTADTIADSSLSDTQVVYAGAAGDLSGNANFTYDEDNEKLTLARTDNGRALEINIDNTTLSGVWVESDDITTGRVMTVKANSADMEGTGYALYAIQDHVDASGHALVAQQEGDGNAVRAIVVSNAPGGANAVFVNQGSNSDSTITQTAGGALHVDNTGNIYGGLTVFSGQTSPQDQPLTTIKSTGTTFDQALLAIDPAVGGNAPHLYLKPINGPTPETPADGMIFMDTDGYLKVRAGGAWVALTGDSGAADEYATRELDNLRDVAVNADIDPDGDNTRSLGDAGNSWADFYADGTSYLATVDIDGGAIDGTDIGANAAAYGEFTEVNADYVELDSSGTEGAPALAWDGDLDTGFYRVDPGVIGVSNNGSLSVTIDATGHLQLSGNGSNALPILALGGETNTGLYQQNDDEITFTHGGTRRYAMRSTGAFQIVGAAGDPAAVAGGIFYNSTENALKYSDGSNWITLTGADPSNVSGSGADTEVTYWTGADTVSGDGEFTYNAGSDTLTVDTISPSTINAFTLGGAMNANSQAITDVNINSGTIDNTAIGGGTASTGSFTYLTAGNNVVFDGGTFVFNESGANLDARFEGQDTDANLLFLDASLRTIGIGTGTANTAKVTVQTTDNRDGIRIDQDNTGDAISIDQVGDGNALEIAHAATANDEAIYVTNNEADQAFFIDQVGDIANSTVSNTAGGAIHVYNHGNLGSAITSYGNDDSATAPLIWFRTGGDFDEQPILQIEGDGTTGPVPLYLVPQGSVAATFNALTGSIYADTDGSLYYNNGGGWEDITTGGDFPEVMDSAKHYTAYENGDVVVQSTIPMAIDHSDEPYENSVMGVVSDNKIKLDRDLRQNDYRIVIGIIGKVKCKVTGEGGPIMPADKLVTSSEPGYAMKADMDRLRSWQIVGTAREPFDGNYGKIEILVGK